MCAQHLLVPGQGHALQAPVALPLQDACSYRMLLRAEAEAISDQGTVSEKLSGYDGLCSTLNLLEETTCHRLTGASNGLML